MRRWCIRRYILRSPYVPIFDYLQTKLWSRRRAPRCTLVIHDRYTRLLLTVTMDSQARTQGPEVRGARGRPPWVLGSCASLDPRTFQRPLRLPGPPARGPFGHANFRKSSTRGSREGPSVSHADRHWKSRISGFLNEKYLFLFFFFVFLCAKDRITASGDLRYCGWLRPRGFFHFESPRPT